MAEIHDTTYKKPEEYRTSRSITIALIVSCSVITLACIAALTIVLAAFFINAPW